MNNYIKYFLITIVVISCRGQSQSQMERNIGGPCEDCEAVLDYTLVNKMPTAEVTLPGFEENEPKIKISGIVYEKNGRTPADNVLLYIYHVDRNGVYKASKEPIGWEQRHGKYRGWLKTGIDGKYTFSTFRPAPYPEVQEPEHIHIYVKEPNTVPYYLDSFVFESDPTLTEKKKKDLENRGGSGIVRLQYENGIWLAQRDLILGLNIPDY
jgi:protocatechuate 3,4-dioxygenase, beta subunit